MTPDQLSRAGRTGGLTAAQRRGNTVLTTPQVEAMRALRAQGWSYGRLAKAFNCGRSTAQHVCQGWRR